MKKIAKKLISFVLLSSVFLMSATADKHHDPKHDNHKDHGERTVSSGPVDFTSWSVTQIIDAHKFRDASEGDVLKLYLSRTSDRNANYKQLKLFYGDWSGTLGDGRTRGGVFKNDDKGVIVIDDHAREIVYTLTRKDAEGLRHHGLRIIGYGVKVDSITISDTDRHPEPPRKEPPKKEPPRREPPRPEPPRKEPPRREPPKPEHHDNHVQAPSKTEPVQPQHQDPAPSASAFAKITLADFASVCTFNANMFTNVHDGSVLEITTVQGKKANGIPFNLIALCTNQASNKPINGGNVSPNAKAYNKGMYIFLNSSNQVTYYTLSAQDAANIKKYGLKIFVSGVDVKGINIR